MAYADATALERIAYFENLRNHAASSQMPLHFASESARAPGGQYKCQLCFACFAETLCLALLA